MGVAGRRVGILAEDHGLDPLERRRSERAKDVGRRRQHEGAVRDPRVHARRDRLRRAVDEERQARPALGSRVGPKGGERFGDGAGRRPRVSLAERLRRERPHRMTMRPSARGSTGARWRTNDMTSFARSFPSVGPISTRPLPKAE